MGRLRSPIPLEDALAIIHETIRAIERTERIPLGAAADRVLARNVVASIAVPPFARAAMDGYAVHAADTDPATHESPVTLRCVEQIFTGQAPRRTLARGECAEISTGAPVPAGADAVVMVEQTSRENDIVRFFAPTASRRNITGVAADIGHGHTVGRVGDVVTPGRAGALAAVGCNGIDVFVQPRVAVLSTGNEIVDPGQVLADGQIFDVNKYTLSTLVARHGCVPQLGQTPGDTLPEVFRALDQCAFADVVVCSGGSSVGTRDLIAEAARTRGVVLFDSVAIKPGKPTGFGRLAGRPLFIMPGNPAACLITAYVLLLPGLRQIARLLPDSPRKVPARLGRRVTSTTGLHHFHTVKIDEGVAVSVFKKAGDITSVAEAHGYIEIPGDVDALEQGEAVDVRLF